MQCNALAEYKYGIVVFMLLSSVCIQYMLDLSFSHSTVCHNVRNGIFVSTYHFNANNSPLIVISVKIRRKTSILLEIV